MKMSFYKAVTISLIAIATGAIEPCHAQQSDYDIGYRWYKAGNYKNAVVFLEKACQNDLVDKAEAHYLAGNCYVHLKMNDEAIKHYRESLLTNHRGLHAKHCIKALKQLKEQRDKLRSARKENNTPTKDLDTSIPSSNEDEVKDKEKDEEDERSKEEILTDKVHNLIGRGDDLISKNRKREGQKLLVEALRMAEKLGSRTDILRKALFHLAEYYRTTNQDIRAADLLRRRHRVSVAMYGRYTDEAMEDVTDVALAYDHCNNYSGALHWYVESAIGWEKMYRKWMLNPQEQFKNSRRELLKAYRNLQQFHEKHGNEEEAEYYSSLRSDVYGQKKKRRRF